MTRTCWSRAQDTKGAEKLSRTISSDENFNSFQNISLSLLSCVFFSILGRSAVPFTLLEKANRTDSQLSDEVLYRTSRTIVLWPCFCVRTTLSARPLADSLNCLKFPLPPGVRAKVCFPCRSAFTASNASLRPYFRPILQNFKALKAWRSTSSPAFQGSGAAVDGP